MNNFQRLMLEYAEEEELIDELPPEVIPFKAPIKQEKPYRGYITTANWDKIRQLVDNECWN